MAQDEKSRLPQPTRLDHAYTAAKALISAVPMAGGSAAELFNAIIAPPLIRRRDKWFQELADGLASLEEEFAGFKIASLADREDFTSVALHTMQVALRTHQQEKIDALRNALLNTALRRSPNEDELAMFVNYIDTFTPWHLRILAFFENPLRATTIAGARTDYVIRGSLAQALENVFHNLRGHREFYDQILDDLHARGLLTGGSSAAHDTISGAGVFAKRTTESGDRFLGYISSPCKSGPAGR